MRIYSAVGHISVALLACAFGARVAGAQDLPKDAPADSSADRSFQDQYKGASQQSDGAANKVYKRQKDDIEIPKGGFGAGPQKEGIGIDLSAGTPGLTYTIAPDPPKK